MIDIRTYGAIPDGVTDCSAAINAALLVGDIIIQNGIFALSQSIKIPSNRTIYGKNAKLKAKNSTFDNIFRNSDFINGNTNINIFGLGNFCLDKNVANNLDGDDTTWGHFASAGAYHYLTMAFCNVTNFEISGLSVVDYPRWMTFMQNCHHGKVHDIFLNFKTTLQRQDGFDTGCKSNDIEIYNIKGYTGDDIFCINTAADADYGINIPGWNVGDVHDIRYHDNIIYNSINGAIMGIASKAGSSIYGITNNNSHLYNGGSAFYSFAIVSNETKDEQHDITMDNVRVDAMGSREAVVMVNENCKNITITNLINNTGKPLFAKGTGIIAENFSINGVVQ